MFLGSSWEWTEPPRPLPYARTMCVIRFSSPSTAPTPPGEIFLETPLSKGDAKVCTACAIVRSVSRPTSELQGMTLGERVTDIHSIHLVSSKDRSLILDSSIQLPFHAEAFSARVVRRAPRLQPTTDLRRALRSQVLACPFPRASHNCQLLFPEFESVFSHAFHTYRKEKWLLPLML